MKTIRDRLHMSALAQGRRELALYGPGTVLDDPSLPMMVVGGRELVADSSRGYVVMDICHAFPSVTAYGTALHPRTLARHYATMRDQVFNLGHRMKSYLTPEQMAALPEREKRDLMLGTIVAVEFPPEPAGGWRLSLDPNPPCIRAAAAFAKQAEGAAVVLRHQDKWSVSQEINFRLSDSGFLVMQPERCQAMTSEGMLLARTTPEEVRVLGLGYVPCAEAPEALMNCYDEQAGAVTKAWCGSAVVLLKGGLGDGEVHWMGVGYVQNPAEKEARVVTVLASAGEAPGGLSAGEAPAPLLREFFTALQKGNQKLLTAPVTGVETSP